MDLRSLRFFLAVAEEKSFIRASKRLFMTQPNLTRTIHALEEEVGGALFIRTKKGVTLTDKGILLRQRAGEILDLFAKTKAEVFSESSKEIIGTVSLAVGETEGLRFLADVMRRISDQHPQISFALQSGNGEFVASRIDAGLADFGLVFEPFNLTQYEHRKLPRMEVWGILCRKDHPLALQDSVSAEALSQYPLIVSAQLADNLGMSGWFGAYASELKIRATYNLIFTAAVLTEENLGVALVFQDLWRNVSDNDLVFRPLSPAMTAAGYLIWKKNRVLSKAADCFYQHLSEALSLVEKQPNP